MTAAALCMSGWIVASACAAVLIGLAIKAGDRAQEIVDDRPWPSGDDLDVLDQPLECLAPADQIRALEWMWVR